jgi:hypothetical protein
VPHAKVKEEQEMTLLAIGRFLSAPLVHHRALYGRRHDRLQKEVLRLVGLRDLPPVLEKPLW